MARCGNLGVDMLGRLLCLTSLALLGCTSPTASSNPGAVRIETAASAEPDPARTRPVEPPPGAGLHELYVAPRGGGLVRIAGTDAVVEAIEDLMPHTVEALAADAEDRVYVADRSSVWIIEDGVVLERTPRVEVGTMSAIHATSAREIWALGSTGLAWFDGEQWRTTPIAELGIERPGDVTIDAAGHVWVMGLTELVRRDGDRFTPVTLHADARALHAFVDAPGHALSIVHVSGIDHYDDDRWTSTDLRFVAGAHVPTGRAWGTTAADFGGGALTVASYMQVTSRMGQWQRSYEVHQQTHPLTLIEGVEVDGRGRSWVTTDGGLLLAEPESADFTWIGPGAIPGVEGRVRLVLALGRGPTLPTLVDPGRGSVRGKLRHRGRALGQARLQLCSFPQGDGSKGQPCDSAARVHEATTGADGKFEVADVVPGRYRLAVAVQPGEWRYLPVDECCVATRPTAPQDLGTIDTERGRPSGW